MAQDSRTVVRSSNQLWGDQVGIINALDAMDSVNVGPFGRDYTPGGSPVIYEFGGGENRRRFVRAQNPYA